MTEPAREAYDTVVIGSGFGGSMAAHELVRAGQKVLMIERGDWVPRGPHNWDPTGSVMLTPFYSKERSYRVLAGGDGPIAGAYACVGGPSVFYGAVSLRLREADFEPDAEIAADSGALWPYSYADLERYYSRAERILGVAGDAGADPTEPFRSSPYPQPPAPASETSVMIEQAARDLGLRPFRLPLAINYVRNERPGCVACTTCDTFACAIRAKNDLATAVLPRLLRQGLRLRENTIALRLVSRGDRIVEVRCFDKAANREVSYRGARFVLAAGALGSPHLLLASGLERNNPAGDAVGRYLMRHCAALVCGFFTRLPDGNRRFHKQIAVHDLYFGDPTMKAPPGKLGGIQQLQSPPVGLIRARLRRPLRDLVAPLASRCAGLLVLAEDQPQYTNRVAIDPAQTGRFGLPQPSITHRYSARDVAAREALLIKAREILREAGAWFCYTYYIPTFSHAAGTVRAGPDPRSSPLDGFCRFRGLENLYVVDASFMPRTGAVNPSLTIAANALRVGEHLAKVRV